MEVIICLTPFGWLGVVERFGLEVYRTHTSQDGVEPEYCKSLVDAAKLAEDWINSNPSIYRPSLWVEIDGESFIIPKEVGELLQKTSEERDHYRAIVQGS